VEAALLAVPGVQSAAVSLTVQQAEVQWDPAEVTSSGGSDAFERQLVEAVEACGFEAAGEPQGV